MQTPNLTPDLFSAQSYYQELERAVERMATAPKDERGAVYTKQEVVDFILDLVGYTSDKPLYRQCLLEPSCGDGRFFLAALDRLLLSFRQASQKLTTSDLKSCLIGVELHKKTFRQLKRATLDKLLIAGFEKSVAFDLCNAWLQQGDFLLVENIPSVDFVVGNPPYIRQEKIPSVLLSAYRAKYTTIYDRADLYVPFFERSLRLLKKEGHLSFICTDRWTKNKYGGPLRKLISHGFSLKTYVDMIGVDAFDAEVATYPAITVIQRSTHSETQILRRPNLDNHKAAKFEIATRIVDGARPWVLGASDKTALIRDLEKRFPLIEQAGCKIGIGVATGADKVYIGKYEDLDVEEQRKLPLAKTSDLRGHQVNWNGLGVVNPFEDNGELAKLNAYPKFKAFVLEHQEILKARHVALKNPEKWYKTIDRIRPSLASMPKLLIPDINGKASIVYEDQGLYPHHNLYFIVSSSWNLRALQTVLLAGVAELFVETYSTKMRGGYLRYQAQYLRKIRLPKWSDVSSSTRKVLIEASTNYRFEEAHAIVCDLYGLRKDQRKLLRPNLTKKSL